MRKPSGVKNEVAELKRSRILKEAADLFFVLGYEATTLDKVAERLGVTKPFIYAQFGGKADLLTAICQKGIADANLALDDALAAKGSAADRLRQAVMAVTATVLREHRYTAIAFREEKNIVPSMKAAMDSMRGSFDAKLASLLDEGCATGDFAIADVPLTSLAIGGMISWAFTWYNPAGRLPPEVICEQIGELVLRMVRRT